jgi:4'-phosphopantetheinyl transferase EntD
MKTLACTTTDIEQLYPGQVSASVSAAYPADAMLIGSEHAATAGMVAKRRNEFTHGRLCARAALTALGAPVVAIPKAADRSPTWPTGVVGSITHTGGAAAAVTAFKRHYRGLGLDIEKRGTMDKQAAEMILRPEELERYTAAEALLVFSIKEAVYKCIYPTVDQYVDFQEMRIELEPEQQRFSAVPQTKKWDPQSIAGLSGGYLLLEHYVLSAAWLAA